MLMSASLLLNWNCRWCVLFERGNVSRAFGNHEQWLKMQCAFAEVKRSAWEGRFYNQELHILMIWKNCAKKIRQAQAGNSACCWMGIIWYRHVEIKDNVISIIDQIFHPNLICYFGTWHPKAILDILDIVAW